MDLHGRSARFIGGFRIPGTRIPGTDSGDTILNYSDSGDTILRIPGTPYWIPGTPYLIIRAQIPGTPYLIIRIPGTPYLIIRAQKIGKLARYLVPGAGSARRSRRRWPSHRRAEPPPTTEHSSVAVASADGVGPSRPSIGLGQIRVGRRRSRAPCATVDGSMRQSRGVRGKWAIVTCRYTENNIRLTFTLTSQMQEERESGQTTKHDIDRCKTILKRYEADSKQTGRGPGR
jgi:hypothetical protein